MATGLKPTPFRLGDGCSALPWTAGAALPVHVGWRVDPDGSRRRQNDRLDDHWGDPGLFRQQIGRQGEQPRQTASAGHVRAGEDSTMWRALLTPGAVALALIEAGPLGSARVGRCGRA